MRCLLVSRGREVHVWLALISITGASWLLGVMVPSVSRVSATSIGIAILSLALLKVRVIIRWFMEIDRAPLALRLLFDAWIAILFFVLIYMYSMGNYGMPMFLGLS